MIIRPVDSEEIEQSLRWLSQHWDRPMAPEYYHARSIDEAVALLDRHKNGARIIAGGLDLLGLMKNRVLFPGVLVNIKRIPGLDRISWNNGGLAMGALTQINDLERSDLIRTRFPLLFEAAGSIGSPQVRNMATIAGNLCQEVRCWYLRRPPETGNAFDCRRKTGRGGCYAVSGENEHHAIIGGGDCYAVCPSDMATALLALDAQVHTVGASGGRVLPLEGFHTALGNILEPAEIITCIRLPDSTCGARQRFLKFSTRNAIDFAMVSVAVVLWSQDDFIRGARIVLGGVAPWPYRSRNAEKALIGRRLTESTAAEAGRAALVRAMPLSNNGYKAQLVETLVKRAVMEAPSE
ncbi:MAG: xanthine dehydrogenase family protein subunit M [Chloroflexi bacterium]|nr:xanthine dehydrogenase family protein subunit M [Chloroflexota bacterium]